jgi:hypothetical protein
MTMTATTLRFEYTTTVLTGGFMGRHSDKINRKTLDAELNRLGGEGWDLRQIMLAQNLLDEKDGHVLVFRRALP